MRQFHHFHFQVVKMNCRTCRFAGKSRTRGEFFHGAPVLVDAGRDSRRGGSYQSARVDWIDGQVGIVQRAYGTVCIGGPGLLIARPARRDTRTRSANTAKSRRGRLGRAFPRTGLLQIRAEITSSSKRLQSLGTDRISSTRNPSSSGVRVNVTLALIRASGEKCSSRSLGARAT